MTDRARESRPVEARLSIHSPGPFRGDAVPRDELSGALHLALNRRQSVIVNSDLYRRPTKRTFVKRVSMRYFSLKESAGPAGQIDDTRAWFCIDSPSFYNPPKKDDQTRAYIRVEKFSRRNSFNANYILTRKQGERSHRG